MPLVDRRFTPETPLAERIARITAARTLEELPLWRDAQEATTTRLVARYANGRLFEHAPDALDALIHEDCALGDVARNPSWSTAQLVYIVTRWLDLIIGEQDAVEERLFAGFHALEETYNGLPTEAVAVLVDQATSRVRGKRIAAILVAMQLPQTPFPETLWEQAIATLSGPVVVSHLLGRPGVSLELLRRLVPLPSGARVAAYVLHTAVSQVLADPTWRTALLAYAPEALLPRIFGHATDDELRGLMKRVARWRPVDRVDHFLTLPPLVERYRANPDVLLPLLRSRDRHVRQVGILRLRQVRGPEAAQTIAGVPAGDRVDADRAGARRRRG